MRSADGNQIQLRTMLKTSVNWLWVGESRPWDSEPDATWRFEIVAEEQDENDVGYTWTSMLWEMYWNLVDLYGFSPDLYAGSVPATTWHSSSSSTGCG